MRITNIIQDKKYLALMIFSSLFMFVFFPVMQSIATGGLQNIDLWFTVIPKINLVLLFIYSVLFGFLLTLQIYYFKTKTCSVNKKIASASSGGIGAFIASVVPACPACFSWVTFLLPASVGISTGQLLIKYSTWLLVFSIGLVLLGLLLLGGFDNDKM